MNILSRMSGINVVASAIRATVWTKVLLEVREVMKVSKSIRRIRFVIIRWTVLFLDCMILLCFFC